MLFYRIKTGSLYSDETFWGTGYSGAGHSYIYGRNNESMVSVHDKGPIPPGVYKIVKPSYHHPKEGPCVMNLTPLPDTNTFGRSAFHIHGNDASNDASHGCIILGPVLREQIEKSTEDFITVTPE